MFGLFKRSTATSSVKPSLNSIKFDTAGYEFQGDQRPGKLRVWFTAEGDGLGLYFFPEPPNIPQNANSIGEIATFYQRLIGNSGGKLVEASVVTAGGCQVVRTIMSTPQQPSGRTYVGSLTVPFRDFSFVLKCQCVENGPTGLKAALLLDRSLAAKEPMKIEGERFHIDGFDVDDPKHDAEFPEDPVARVRRVLDHLSRSLVIEADVGQLPGFVLPRM